MRAIEEQLKAKYREGEGPCVAHMLAREARIDELEATRATSKNSSTPPSQDPHRAKTKKKRWKRKQRRHHTGGRALRPASEVDEFRDVHPERCAYCGLPLSEHAQHVGTPGRYQQVEIPPPEATLTEWRRHSVRCGACGHTTKADIPAEALQRFGPRLRAAIATMVSDKRQTHRQLVELLR